ncbi:choline kinase cytoplasm [Leucogyrophana mollusca]|uniref:Choline kinase cytoplasm n=1 Tax=Leucogyrophana mollusca TaxID=85980 RepID=A0ACB8AZJ5_9AGAM|nr:choline kinase cytoplasm [Leucogyrophana mollusca]
MTHTSTLLTESPTIYPQISVLPVSRPLAATSGSRRSSESLSSLCSLVLDSGAPPNSSLNQIDDSIDVEVVNGIRNASTKLDARHYKSPAFASRLLSILIALRVPAFHRLEHGLKTLKIHKVSGSLTNAVFFVSCPDEPLVPTLLLRIYGPSSGSLISRPRELHTLHVLSSQYRIGPRIYGTFHNGRIEEYFDSVTLQPHDLRDKKTSHWIGARMAELHSVDINAVEGPLVVTSLEGKSWEIGVKKNVKTWLQPARDVLALPNVSDGDRKALDMDHFLEQWTRYMRWISHTEKIEGSSRRVFAHNDTQYGNLLRINGKLKEGAPEHRQIVVVDFEYASPNPLAFDIANHFHEWTANYHSSTPHVLDPSRYPTLEERRNFYRAYLEHCASCLSSPSMSVAKPVTDSAMAHLDRQIHIWSPASHGMWAVWGIVQAREDLERGESKPEFDYIGYAKCRMESFRRELHGLGV